MQYLEDTIGLVSKLLSMYLTANLFSGITQTISTTPNIAFGYSSEYPERIVQSLLDDTWKIFDYSRHIDDIAHVILNSVYQAHRALASDDKQKLNDSRNAIMDSINRLKAVLKSMDDRVTALHQSVKQL